MAVTLSPEPFQQFFNLGLPLSNGFVYTYVAGSTTPIFTFKDSSSTSNTNPIILDAQGRCSIYLTPGQAYKYIITDSLGNPVWTQDNIVGPFSASGGAGIAFGVAYYAADSASLVGTAAGSVGALLTGNGGFAPSFQPGPNTICQGRLTLTSGTPVTTADVTAATSVFWSPYAGNRIALYDGVSTAGFGWQEYVFSEITIPVPATTVTMYDVFAFATGGAVSIEVLAWTSDTVRAVALVQQDGILSKTGFPTRRYLGSFRTTGAAGQTEDSIAKRYVWNYYNRVSRILRVVEPANTWVYTLAAYRQANANAANQLDVVIGWPEVILEAETIAAANNPTGVVVQTAIGEDSTTVKHTGCVNALTIAVAATEAGAISMLRTYPAVGRHVYVWLEWSQAVDVTTWIGDNGGTITQSGIHGRVDG